MPRGPEPQRKRQDRVGRVLANLMGTLNRLLWKAGMGKVDEEDLAQILSKIPEKYVKIVEKGIKSLNCTMRRPSLTLSQPSSARFSDLSLLKL